MSYSICCYLPSQKVQYILIICFFPALSLHSLNTTAAAELTLGKPRWFLSQCLAPAYWAAPLMVTVGRQIHLYLWWNHLYLQWKPCPSASAGSDPWGVPLPQAPSSVSQSKCSDVAPLHLIISISTTRREKILVKEHADIHKKVY